MVTYGQMFSPSWKALVIIAHAPYNHKYIAMWYRAALVYCALWSVSVSMDTVSPVSLWGFAGFSSAGQPPLSPQEDPPQYSPVASPESSSAPMISCRVCQSLISVEGKIHQHVVKCGVCNEATVGTACHAPGYTHAQTHTRSHRHTLTDTHAPVCVPALCTFFPYLFYCN